MSYENISKFISLLLRHKPEVLNLSMDEHGWVQTEELIAGIAKKQYFTMEMLEEIVRTDEKNRYSFNEDKTLIRANQGHSIAVDVELEQAEPPEYLWHGTGEKFAASIEKEGLLPKSRLYVHLSTDKETAWKVGKRHGNPVLYQVDCRRMVEDGFAFYRSANGVWLTKSVPVAYLEQFENNKNRLLGFFSGFPKRCFPENIANILANELINRDLLVFISAWPEDYNRNDQDSYGMYGMFEAWGMAFEQYCVIDNRMESFKARRMILEASCVFLMGGHPGLQYHLMRDKGLVDSLRITPAMILGVSAGAINMAKRSLDTKESNIPYDGLGLADITIKPHFEPENQELIEILLEISQELPIYAMEDESAILVKNSDVSYIGNIYRIDKGKITIRARNTTKRATFDKL